MRITLREKKRKLSAKVKVPDKAYADRGVVAYITRFNQINILKPCPMRIGDKVYD